VAAAARLEVVTTFEETAMTATATATAKTVRTFFGLLSQKDIAAWTELWHPDAVISVPYPADGFPTEIRGKDQIASGFRGLFANFDTFTAHLTAVYPAADSDAVCVEYSNVAILTDGTEYTNDNIAVFRFRDGLITEYHDYFDPRRFQVVVDALSRS
jgi:uncharacterized protein